MGVPISSPRRWGFRGRQDQKAQAFAQRFPFALGHSIIDNRDAIFALRKGDGLLGHENDSPTTFTPRGGVFQVSDKSRTNLPTTPGTDRWR